MLRRYMVVLFGPTGHKPVATKTTESESPEDALRSTLRIGKDAVVNYIETVERRVKFFEHDGIDHIVYEYP